jgi:hypothetical protein
MAIRKLLKAIPGARRLASFVRRYPRRSAQNAILRRLKKAGTGPFQRDPSSPVVVSLTSFPARIHLVWRTIESIFQQDTKPARVVLVLSTEDFPDKVLPSSIVSQYSRGLDVLWTVQNTRAYKKLLPTKQAFPEATIVTVDDDVIYDPWMLTELIGASRATPNAVIGHRGRVITGTPPLLQPYEAWPMADPSSPRSRVLLTGVGGVLYPPDALAIPTLQDYETAKRLCPLADDIWFWACSRLANTFPLCLGNECWSSFDDAQATESLYQVNGPGGMNDLQFKAVCDNFGLWGSLDAGPPRSL